MIDVRRKMPVHRKTLVELNQTRQRNTQLLTRIRAQEEEIAQLNKRIRFLHDQLAKKQPSEYD